MAYFAKLDENSLVTNIFLIDDSNAVTETSGIAHCNSLYGEGTYVQFYQDGFKRQRPASVGHFYDTEKDIFYWPKPYNSWVWSESEKEYIAPIAKPSVDLIGRSFPYTDTEVMANETVDQYVSRLAFSWDEESRTWIATEYTTAEENGEIRPVPTGNTFSWNSTNSTWDAI